MQCGRGYNRYKKLCVTSVTVTEAHNSSLLVTVLITRLTSLRPLDPLWVHDQYHQFTSLSYNYVSHPTI